MVDLDEYPGDSQLTRMQLIVLSVGAGAEKIAPDLAAMYWRLTEGQTVSAKLSRLFGKGGPSDELLTKFYLSILSITLHQLILHSAQIQPDNPHSFQDRLVAEVLDILVPPAFREIFVQACNENIGHLQQLSSGKIDVKTYVIEMSGKFFAPEERPFASFIVASMYSTFTEIKNVALETLSA